MSDDKMCPILTIGEAVILSSLERYRTTDTLTLDHCWRMCEGESCAMYERCVPQMLTVVAEPRVSLTEKERHALDQAWLDEKAEEHSTGEDGTGSIPDLEGDLDYVELVLDGPAGAARRDDAEKYPDDEEIITGVGPGGYESE